MAGLEAVSGIFRDRDDAPSRRIRERRSVVGLLSCGHTGGNVSGEGPAFFGVLAIMIVLPIGLALTGVISGLIAAALHRPVDRTRDTQMTSNEAS